MEHQNGDKKFAGVKESFYGYTSSVVVEMLYRIPITFCSNEREPKIRVLHKTVSLMFSEIEEICSQGFPETGWDLRVNCFSILAPYCCDISEEKK